MSNKLVNMVDQAEIGDMYAKAVLRKIADQSNDEGQGVWSSHSYIAWCLEVSRKTVVTKCAYLHDMGLLDWELRRGTSNLYQVNPETLAKLQRVWRGENDSDMSPEVTGVLPEVTGDVTDSDTSPLNSPNLTNDVIQPDGTPVEEKDVCAHCKSAPKASRKAKYCPECKNLGMCARCGEHKVERYPVKRRELCHVCGPVVDEFFNSRAVLTFAKRSIAHLSWGQAEAIAKVVGNEVPDLIAWGRWLDYWKASGWFMGANAVGKILDGYKEKKAEFTDMPTPIGAPKSSVFDKYRPSRKPGE